MSFQKGHSFSSAAPSTSRTTLRVCISICFFFAQISVKKFLERKAGENTEKYSIYDFENPYKWGISGGRNDQAAVKFRVRAVITTSIPLHRICSANTDKKCKKWEPFRAAAVLNTVERLFAFYTAQSIITACRTEIKPGPEKSEHSGRGRKFLRHIYIEFSMCYNVVDFENHMEERSSYDKKTKRSAGQ